MRDCEHCKHHKENGCEVWECDYEDKEDNKQGMESGATSET